MHYGKNILAAAVGCGMALSAGQSNADDAERILDEIVVSATKRAESIQDVPISITALSENEIAATSSQNLRDLADSVTNMIYPDSAYAGGADISIRGIFSRVDPFQTGFDSGFSVYLDGVYLGRSFSNNADLGEIERVEVLKGPQGTLFGKNTIAGAINIVSKKPDTSEYGASLTAEAGNYDLQRLRGSLNVPLIENTLAARVSYQTAKRDGYIENMTIPGDDRANADIDSGRLQLAYTPSEQTNIYLNIDLLNSHYNPQGGYSLEFTEVTPIAPREDVFVEGVDFDFIPYTTFRSIREPVVQKNRGMSLTAEHHFDNDFTLTSITGWRDDDIETVQDIDALPYDVYHVSYRDNSQKMLTQELRISSPAYERYDFVAGLYYLKQENEYKLGDRIGVEWFGAGLEGIHGAYENEVNVDSFAAFFHGNIHLNDSLTLFGGARFTAETKEQILTSSDILLADDTPSAFWCGAFGATCGTNIEMPVDIDDDEISWTIGLRYAASDNMMAYGSVARGFKSGAFNFSTNPQNDFDNQNLLADPEFVTSYELGLKSDWFSNRLRINGAVFYMDYEDLQVKAFCPTCGVLGTGANILSNAAAVTSRGFELEVKSYLTDKLDVSVGVGYVDSTFDDFMGLALPRGAGAPGDENDGNPTDGFTDASGNRVPLAPKWTVNAAVQYDHTFADGNHWLSRVDYSYTDERYAAEGASNSAEYLLPSYGTVRVRTGYEASDARWGVFLWAKNLTDKAAPDEARFSAFVADRFGYRYIEPRTYGLTFDYNF